MKKVLKISLLSFLFILCLNMRSNEAGLSDKSQPVVRIGRLVSGKAISRRYPNALPTLLKYVNKETTMRVSPQPVIIESFEDERLFELPFIYVNFADRDNWEFSDKEKENLKQYLELGGFIYVDAGINAEFLRKDKESGQHHSFAEWRASPPLKEAFASIFPGKEFQSLPHSHPIFRCYFEGLPDTSVLPDTVKSFVEKEKWPDGTYSAVGLSVKGRIAVLATPIISMGWGKNTKGNWITTIRFRIREETTGLGEVLSDASYAGSRFETVREDGGKDIIFCQQASLPAWVQEPNNRWRVFRYYGGKEISDFAHVFYSRLGTNFMIYALTH